MAWSSCGGRSPKSASARHSWRRPKMCPALKPSTIISVGSIQCPAWPFTNRTKSPLRRRHLEISAGLSPMKAHPDIVAIGASSGGIEALQGLLEALLDLHAIVLVVLHRPANRASYLRDILLRNVRMPVVVARHGERLHKGVCYIGEPSQPGRPRSARRPFTRPSIHYAQHRSAVHVVSSAIRSEDHWRGAFGAARRWNAWARGHQESRWNCHGPESVGGCISGHASQRDQLRRPDRSGCADFRSCRRDYPADRYGSHQAAGVDPINDCSESEAVVIRAVVSQRHSPVNLCPTHFSDGG